MNTPGVVRDFDEDESPPPPPPPEPTAKNNDEFIAAMIPQPWERHFDHEEHRHFFYNPISGDCLWETESVLDAIFEEMEHSKQQQYQQQGEHDIFDLAEFEMEMDSAMSETTHNSVYTGISNGNLSVVDRSNITMQSKQQKVAELQQARDLAEQQSMRSQPQLIAKQSQSFQSRSVEDMLVWEEERQQRLVLNAQRAREAEDIQLTGRPTLTSLAHQHHSDNAVVEQRLLVYEQKRQVKLAQRREEQDRIAKEISHPTITSFSHKLAAMAADQSVGGVSHVSERLYSLRRPVVEEGGGGQELAVGRLSQHDPVTGQRLFEPRLNATSAILAQQHRFDGGNGNVEEQLLSMGQRYQQRLLEKQKRVIAEETRLRQLSKVNPRSEKLLQKRSDTTQDRLLQPIGMLKSHVAEEMNRCQPSFTPQISEGSRAILRDNQRYQYYNYANGDGGGEEGGGEGEGDLYSGQFLSTPTEAIEIPRGQTATLLSSQQQQYQQGRGNRVYERSMLWAKQKAQRQEVERAKMENQLRQECSFQPFAAPSAPLPPPARSNGGSKDQHISYRHGIWLQQKEEKLSIQRRQQEMDEVKDCTFVPKVPVPGQEVRKAMISRARSRSRSADRSAVRSSGHNKHLQHLNGTGGGSVSISSGGYSSGNHSHDDRSSSQDPYNSPRSINNNATNGGGGGGGGGGGRFSYRSGGGGGSIPVNYPSRPNWLRDPDLYSSDFESLENLAHMQIQSPSQLQQISPMSPQQSFASNNYSNHNGSSRAAGVIPIISSSSHQYYQQQLPQQQQQPQQNLWQQQPRQLREPDDDIDDDLTAPSQAVDLI